MNEIIASLEKIFTGEKILSALGLALIAGIVIYIIYKIVSRVIPQLHKAQIIDRIVTETLDNANKMVMRELKIDIRSCVFYTDKKRNKLRIFFTSSDFDNNSPERHITFKKGNGVVGQSWALNEGIVANVEKMIPGEIHHWGLTKSQLFKTKKLTAILAIPIHFPNEEEVIGILAFDTVEENAYNKFRKQEFTVIAKRHAEIVEATFKLIGLQ